MCRCHFRTKIDDHTMNGRENMMKLYMQRRENVTCTLFNDDLNEVELMENAIENEEKRDFFIKLRTITCKESEKKISRMMETIIFSYHLIYAAHLRRCFHLAWFENIVSIPWKKKRSKTPCNYSLRSYNQSRHVYNECKIIFMFFWAFLRLVVSTS